MADRACRALSALGLFLFTWWAQCRRKPVTGIEYTRLAVPALAGKFRSQHDLDRMSHDDQRNTLIVEIAARSRQTNLQSFNDEMLAGMGAVLVFLKDVGMGQPQRS